MTEKNSGTGECSLSRSTMAAFVLLLLLPAPVVHLTLAQEMKSTQNAGTTGAGGLEAPPKAAGIPYRSGRRRDPFLNPLILKKEGKYADEELPRGLPPPGIAGTYIAQAVLQGTSRPVNGSGP